jgi:putative oxidoreductase
MAIGTLVLRVVVGGLFMGHGLQKLFGWFGGHGIEGTTGMVERLRYRPSRPFAVLAGLTETLAGLCFALGFLTPLAAAGIIGMMASAIVAVHLRNGLWNTNGGIELPLTYATVAAAVVAIGPGTFSLDRALDLDLSGVGYAVGAIGLGCVVAFIGLATRSPLLAAEQRSQADTGRHAA